MTESRKYATETGSSPAFLAITRTTLALFLTVVAVYGGYWIYLSRFSLRPMDNTENEIFLALGQAVVALELGSQERIKAVPNSVSGPEMCRFWTFEAIRTRCRGLGIVVLNYEESEREAIVGLARRIGDKLARPCEYLNVLEAKRQSMAATQLGCGRQHVTFTLRVQAFSSELISLPSGGGAYRNEHIYTHTRQGVI